MDVATRRISRSAFLACAKSCKVRERVHASYTVRDHDIYNIELTALIAPSLRAELLIRNEME